MTARPFLMFEGACEEALTFYAATIPGTRIDAIDRWDTGKVRVADMVINGLAVRASDSPAAHDFTFTPSISFWIDCGDEAEIDRLAAALGEGGRAYMPLGDYGFSRRFAWVGDRFGITWQLNLA